MAGNSNTQSKTITSNAGASKAIIDWKEVGRWLEADCEGKKIADHYGVHYNTLARRCKEDLNIDFGDFRRQKKAEGNEVLLNSAYELARNGDKTMLIFLLKNRCGYRDNPEPEFKPQAIDIVIDEPSAKVSP